MKTALQPIAAHYAGEWGFDPSAFDGAGLVLAGEIGFRMVCMGGGVVIRATADMADWCREHLLGAESKELFDGARMYELETELRRHGMKLRGVSVGYLAERVSTVPVPGGYELRLMEREELNAFPDVEAFPMALNGDGEDALAVAAVKDGVICGIASADDDWGELWQIGVNVKPAHRGAGLAVAMVTQLAGEIIRRGHTPFYVTWPGNLASTRTAIRSGFIPMWLSVSEMPEGWD